MLTPSPVWRIRIYMNSSKTPRGKSPRRGANAGDKSPRGGELRPRSRACFAFVAWKDGLGLLQVEVARRLSLRVGRNVSQSTVSRIERGLMPHPDLRTALSKMAKIPAEWWREAAAVGRARKRVSAE